MNVPIQTTSRPAARSGWRTALLGEVARIVAGAAAPQHASHFAAQGPAFVRVSDLARANAEGVLTETASCLSASAQKELQVVKVSAGTILFPKSGATVATNARVQLGMDAYIVSHLMGVEVRDPTLARWLYWWLTTVDMMAIADNVAYPSVRQTAVAKLRAPIPPPHQLPSLVAAMDKQMTWVAEARRNAAQRVAAATALPAAILRQAFREITPLSVDAKRADRAPSGWAWIPLSKLAKLESGHTPSRKRPEWWGGSIPWLALPDIRALDGGVAMDTAEHTNEDGIANSSARVLPTGTVAMSRTASVGFVTVFGRPMATSQDFVNWTCGPDLDNWFLAYLLMASRAYILSIASGAIHKTIYMPTVEAFRVCVPPVSEQKRLSARLREEVAASTRIGEAVTAETQALSDMPVALLRATLGEN